MADTRIEDLSDDEIRGMSPEQFAALAAAEEAGGNNADGDANQNDDAAAKAEADEAARLAAEEAAATAANANPPATKGDDDENAAATSAGDQANGAEAGKSVDAPTGEGKEAGKGADKAQVVEPTTSEYKTQLDALYAPFKANGREMKVQSVEEARQLMSMGANYNKKMQAMKPHLGTLRMLENAGIKDTDLSFLIDLHKKDPAAINRLVKDSKIDPMDLSAEKADGYQPRNHRPADAEVELDAVIEDLKESPAYSRTLDIAANKMDTASKQLIATNPGVLKVINGHVELGIYDLVQAEVDRERTFGRLTGLSDLEAYRQVGDAMNASGKFAHLGAGQPTPNQGQQTQAAPVVVPPNPQKADDSKRNAQKRGVAPVKGASSPTGGKVDPDFNPLSLSDEEFAKQFARK